MAAFRVIFLPYAGAGAGVFSGLAKRLPIEIEPFALQLPARETRLDDPAITDWRSLIEKTIAAITSLPAGPIALFGHSFGAVAALEVARAWPYDPRRPLAHLGCGARAWPGDAATKPAYKTDVTTISDAEMPAYLEKCFGAAPPSFAHPDIRDVAMVALRADLALLSTYAWEKKKPLDCPLTIYAGENDPATRDADLRLWRQETTGAFDIKELPAGHYFLETHGDVIIDDIVADFTRRPPQ